MTLRSFIVNKYITLLLKDGKTEIYVNNELFLNCKKLVLQLNESNFEEFEAILSIDDLAERDDLGGQLIDIPPDVEFWGHCSNIQAWVDNDYNPSLLHSNLAFPLLKKLTDEGDSRARVIFKEEIIERFEQGTETVLISLLDNQYLEYFTRDELQYIYENFVEPLEPSNRLLTFLKAFCSQQVFPIRGYYEKFVKEFMITAKYKEKIKILNKHGAILRKDDFLGYFKKFSSGSGEGYEENDRFNVLSVLILDLEFYGILFDNASKINYLLRKVEQDSLQNILNHSKYPYIMMDFEEDEVRRRVWQEKLYYDLYDGHVVSIELICENPEEFLDNIQKLNVFKNLVFVNVLFFHYRDYESIKSNLTSLHHNKVKIYIFDDSSPYLKQLKIV